MKLAVWKHMPMLMLAPKCMVEVTHGMRMYCALLHQLWSLRAQEVVERVGCE